MDSCFYCDQATRAVHVNPVEKYYLQLFGRPFIIAGDMRQTLLYCGLFFAAFAAARFVAAWNVSDMNETDKIDVFFKLGNQIALGDLFME